MQGLRCPAQVGDVRLAGYEYSLPSPGSSGALLKLSGAQLNNAGELAASIDQVLPAGASSTLGRLHLDECQLEEVAVSGCSHLGRLHSLVICSCEPHSSLPALLEQASSLTSLSFTSTGYDGLDQLPHGVAQLRGLKSLVLRKNAFLEELPADVLSLPELEELVVVHSCFYEALPPGIAAATGLTRLEVGDFPRTRLRDTAPALTAEHVDVLLGMPRLRQLTLIDIPIPDPALLPRLERQLEVEQKPAPKGLSWGVFE
jgi:hypothetical protein